MAAIFPSVAEPKRRATYEDVIGAPDDQIAEILGGELFLSPRPAFPHANATTSLAAEIHGKFHGPPGSADRPGGWWILFEPELHLADDVVVPDLAGWRRGRLPRLPDTAWCSVSPDWVCETVSPATVTIDRGRKLGIYARAGVAHLWLLDPVARTLDILHLGPDRAWVTVGVYVGSARPHAQPFDAVELDLTRLWVD